jgi:hypothetical protein
MSDTSYIELVDASATAQVLGKVGAIGDRIDRIIISPKSAAPGVVTLLDNAVSYPIYFGGADATLRSFTVELGLESGSGPWKVTTGANVQALCIGEFS